MTGLSASQLRANRRTGRAWELACLAWLRTHGWPGAERHADKQASDITGVGDLALEVTTDSWDHLGGKSGKLTQAWADGQRRNLDTYVVWKKAHNVADPGYGLIVTHAWVWWAVWRRLEDLDQAEAAAGDAWQRGFDAGLRERTGT